MKMLPRISLTILIIFSLQNIAFSICDQITGSDNVCTGILNETYDFNDNASCPSGQYVWSIIDPMGGANPTISGSNILETVDIDMGSMSGSFTLQLVYSNPYAETYIKVITIDPLPTASILGDISVCVGDTDPLITFNGADGSEPYTFTYTINGGSDLTVITSGGSSSVTVPQSTTTAGTFTYTLVNVADANCSQSQTGTASIIVNNPPTCTAGSYPAVCSDSPNITLNGMIGGGATIGTWSSSGTGVFTPTNTTLNATYSPSPDDITNGAVTLTLTTDAPSGCTAAVDMTVITIGTLPTSTAGSYSSVCSDSPNITLNGMIGGGATIGTWSSSGTGVFTPTNTTLNATYSPSPDDITNGAVTLTLTTDAPSGCIAAVDMTVITIVALPTSTAGSYSPVCSDSPDITLNGMIGGGATIGTWSSSGTGVFTPTNTTLNATYSPSPNDITNGAVTLTLTTDAPSGCAAAVDMTVITIGTLPTSTAGSYSSVCADSPDITLNGMIGGGATIGTWSSSGTGVFTPTNTTLNATYSPSLDDITNGAVTLTLTTDAPSGCISAVDMTVITINPLPTATISGDVTTCLGDTPEPLVTFTGANGTEPYTFTYNIDQTVTTSGGSSTVTVTQSTTVAGSFKYSLVSVTDGTCSQSQSGEVDIVVNPLPNLTIDQITCDLDLQHYSIEFTSNGDVASDFGDVNNTSNIITNIPKDQNVILTSTLLTCVTTLPVIAPDCSCPSINPPISNGDEETCFEDVNPELSVTVDAGHTANWYEVSSGGTAVATETTTYTSTESDVGTYSYWVESEEIVSGCPSTIRTEITFTIKPLPIVDPSLVTIETICDGETSTGFILASIPAGSTYTWTSAATGVTGNAASGTNNIPGETLTLTNATQQGQVTYTVTPTLASCTGQTTEFTVIIDPRPTVEIPAGGATETICDGGTSTGFDLNSLPSGANFTWTSVASGVSGNLPSGIMNIPAEILSLTGASAGTVTYTVIPTLNNCEGTPQDFIVNVIPNPTLTVSSKPCDLGLVTYTIFFETNGTVISTEGTVDNVNNTVSGILVGNDVTLTSTSGECVTELFVQSPICECPIGINAPISTGNKTACFGSANPELSVTVDVDHTANWYLTSTGGSPFLINSLTFTPTDSDIGIHSYFVESQDLDDCVSQSRTEITLTIFELPVPVISPEDPFFCAGSSVTLDAGNFNEYLWSIGGITTQTIEADNSIVYTVTVTDINNCTGSASVIPTELVLPFAIAGNDVIYCEDDTPADVVFSFSSSSMVVNATYQLNSGPLESVVIDASQLLTITNPSPGTYKVTSVINQNCETLDNYQSEEVTVIENPKPVFEIIGNDKICSYQTSTLSADINNPGDYTHLWQTPDPDNNGSTNQEILANIEGSYILTLTKDNCSSMDTFNLEISVVNATLTYSPNDLNVCLGKEVELTINDANSIVWNNPDEPDNTGTVTVMPTELDNTFSAIAKNDFLCEILLEVEFNIFVPLEVDISVSPTETAYCEGEEITLTTNDGFTSWIWNNGEEEQSNTIITQDGTESFSVEVLDNNLCENSATFDINVTEKPSIEIMTEDNEGSVFTGEPYEFSAINPTTDSECQGSGLVSYHWEFKTQGGVVHFESIGSSNILITNFELPDTLITNLTLTVTDNCGCMSDPITIPFYVYEDGSCYSKFEDLEEIVCLGSETTLLVSINSGNDGGQPQFGYFTIDGKTIDKDTDIDKTYNTPNGSFKLLQKSGTIQNMISDIDIKFEEVGEYEILFNFAFTNCGWGSSQTISVVDLPEIDVFTFDPQVCYDESPKLEFIIVDEFDGLWTLDYDIGNGNQEKTLQFGSNNNSLTFANLTEDLTIVLGNLKSENTSCETNYNESYTIEVLDQLTTTIVDTCNTTFDTIFYTIYIEGGTGDFSIPNTTKINSNTFRGNLLPSGQILTYIVEDLGCKEDNELDLAVSETCFSCFDIVEYIDDNNISLPSKINICNNETYLFTFPFNIENDTLKNINQELLYVIQKNATSSYQESNILFKFNPTAIDGPFTFNIDSSEEFSVGVDYFLTVYPVPETSTFLNPDCNAMSNIPLEFFAAPITELNQLEDLDICSNEIDYQIGIKNSADENIWKSNIDGIHIIHYVEGENFALVDFDQLISASITEIKLSFTQNNHYESNTLTCSDQDSIELHVVDKTSPSKDSIIWWPGNLLTYTEDNLCYQWGINESEITGETTRFFIHGNDIGADIIWIDVWDCGDDLKECVTRVYYNALGPPKLVFKPELTLDMNLYPNPNNGEFLLELDGKQGGNYMTKIFSTTGTLVHSQPFIKEYRNHQEIINIQTLSDGLYIVQVIDEGGQRFTFKIIKQ